MTSSRETFEAAFALMEAGRAQAEAEFATSQVRVAKLEAVKALSAAGEETRARELLAEVRAEQETLT